MGNSICDRLFFSLTNGDSIREWWSPEHQEAMANLASLGTLGRQHALKDLTKKIDKEMMKYYQVSSTERGSSYQIQSASEQSEILPYVDPHTAQRWSLDDTTTFLKDLRHLIKDADNTTTIVNEINYLTHLYLLYESYRDRIKKEADGEKPSLMTSCLEARQSATQKKPEHLKDSFISGVVKVTLESLVASAKSIVEKEDSGRLPMFTKKCQQIADTINDKDRACHEDRTLITGFENLVIAIFNVVSRFDGKGQDIYLSNLTAFTIKLSFYLGKVSFHLRVMKHLVKSGQYKTLKIGQLNAIKEVEEGLMPLVVQLEKKSYGIEPTENCPGNETTFMVEHNRIIGINNKKKFIYNRYPDYARYFPSLYVENDIELKRMFMYRSKTHFLDDNKIITFSATSLDDSNSEAQTPVAVLDPHPHDQPAGRSVIRLYPVEVEQFIVILTEIAVDGESMPVYRLLYYLQTADQPTAALVHDIDVVVQAGKLQGRVVPSECRSVMIDFVDGLILVVNDGVLSSVIDPFSGQCQPVESTKTKINGIDSVRKKFFHLAESGDKPLTQTRFTTTSKYVIQNEFFKNLSTKLPGTINPIFVDGNRSPDCNFLDYFMLLVSLTSSNPLTSFSSDLDKPSTTSEKQSMIFIANKIELKTETMDIVLNMFEAVDSISDSACRQQLQVGMLKILDSHLNVACLIQNTTKDTMKVMNQEMITKLRRLVMNLSMPDSCPRYNRAAFDEMKINVISNLIHLNNKVKKAPDTKILARLVLSSNVVHSHSTVTKFLCEISKLKSKSMPNFDAFMNSLIDDIKVILKVEVSREIDNITNSKLTMSTQESIIVGSNLKAFYTSAIGLRLQMDDTLISQLVFAACDSIKPAIDAITLFLKGNASLIDKVTNLSDIETTVLTTFSSFIMVNAVTYMSYAQVWPELVDSMLHMCKQFTITAKSLKFPKQMQSYASKEDSVKVYETTTDLVSKGKMNRNWYSFPLYMQIEILVTGADDALDHIVVFTEQEFDSHEQGRDGDINKKYSTPNCVVRNNQPIVVNANKIYLVVLAEKIKPDNNYERNIKVTMTGKDLAIESCCRLETLSALCSNFVTQHLLKEIKHLNEKESLIDQLPEKVAQSLEITLASPLFSNGFNAELFATIDKSFEVSSDISGEMEGKQSLCHLNYLHITSLLQMTEVDISEYHILCDRLQTDVKRKSHHASILGEVGMILAKSLFLVALKHYDKLDMLLFGFKEKNQEFISDAELKKIWLGCTKIRTMSRTFETDRQFHELYRKLIMLIAIEPSSKWKEALQPSSPQRSPELLNEGVFKMKVYIEELRVNNAGPSATSTNELIESLLRFLGLQATVSDITKIIEQRGKHFDLFGKAIELILQLVKQQEDNIYEALLIFNQIFRKNKDTLEYLMVDYSGLAKHVVNERISQIAQLIGFIVDFICKTSESSESSEKEILLALESLKWKWRGKEVSCIHKIDISKIWHSCSLQFGQNEKFRQSIIDLCFILLRFCARKAKDLQHEDNDDMLSLKRQTSVVDENSMAAILNQNFTFLIDIIGKDLHEIKIAKAVLTESEYEDMIRPRNKEPIAEMIYDAIAEEDGADDVYSVDIDHINDLDSYKARVKIQKPAANDDSKIGDDIKNENNQEIVVDSSEFTKYKSTVEKVNITLTGDKKKYDRCIEEVSSILSVFYYYLYSSPDMATLFFEHEENLNPIIDICLSNYPETLTIQACNIIELLAPLFPVAALSEQDRFIRPLLISMQPFYDSIFTMSVDRLRVPSKNLLSAYQSVLRSLLMNKYYSNTVVAVIQKSGMFESTSAAMLVLDTLDFDSVNVVQVGGTVYDRFDAMKEQMIILKSTPSMFTNLYMRDILHYRYDITVNKECRGSKLDRLNLNSLKYPCYILRTKNYRYLLKEEIGRFRALFDKNALSCLIDELDLLQLPTKINSDCTTGMLMIYKLIKIISSSENPKFKDNITSLGSMVHQSKHRFTEQECNTSIYDRLHHIARHSCLALPNNGFDGKSQVEHNALTKYQLIKKRIYNNIRISNDRELKPLVKSYWETQFGSQGIPKDRKLAFNIALYKPTLELDIHFDSPSASLQSSRDCSSDLLSILKQGACHAILKYRYATRSPSDFRDLLVDIGSLHSDLYVRDCRMADVSELNTMIDIIISECKDKDSIHAMCDHLFANKCLETSTNHNLLSKLVARSQNKDLNAQYGYYLFDIVHRIATATVESSPSTASVQVNTRLLSDMVAAIDKFVEITTRQPLHVNDISKIDDILSLMDIDMDIDSYAYKRRHKISDCSHLLLHFIRYVLLTFSGSTDSLSVSSRAVFSKVQKINTTLKDLAKRPSNKKQDDSWKDILIRGILYNKLKTDKDFKKLHKLTFNQRQTSYPLNYLNTPQSVPLALYKVDIASNHVSFELRGMPGDRGLLVTAMNYDNDMGVIARLNRDVDISTCTLQADTHTSTLILGITDATVVNHIRSHYDAGDAIPSVYGICNAMINDHSLMLVDAKLYAMHESQYDENKTYRLYETGIDLFEGAFNNERSNCIYYKAKDKQFVNLGEKIKPRRALERPYFMNREERSYFGSVFDLSIYPIMAKIQKIDEYSYGLADVTGGCLLISPPEWLHIGIAKIYNQEQKSKKSDEPQYFYFKNERLTIVDMRMADQDILILTALDESNKCLVYRISNSYVNCLSIPDFMPKKWSTCKQLIGILGTDGRIWMINGKGNALDDKLPVDKKRSDKTYGFLLGCGYMDLVPFGSSYAVLQKVSPESKVVLGFLSDKAPAGSSHFVATEKSRFLDIKLNYSQGNDRKLVVLNMSKLPFAESGRGDLSRYNGDSTFSERHIPFPVLVFTDGEDVERLPAAELPDIIKEAISPPVEVKPEIPDQVETETIQCEVKETKDESKIEPSEQNVVEAPGESRRAARIPRRGRIETKIVEKKPKEEKKEKSATKRWVNVIYAVVHRPFDYASLPLCELLTEYRKECNELNLKHEEDKKEYNQPKSLYYVIYQDCTTFEEFPSYEAYIDQKGHKDLLGAPLSEIPFIEIALVRPTPISILPKFTYLKKSLQTNLHLISENRCFTAAIFPDILNLTQDQWSRVKEFYHEAWHDDLVRISDTYESHVDMAMMIMKKQLSRNDRNRLNTVTTFASEFDICNTREYGDFEESGEKIVDKPDFDKVIDGLRLLNYGYMGYASNLPVYHGKILDMAFRQKAVNVIPVFDMISRGKATSENYIEYYVNRFMSLKYTTLKRQNFSLLNQLIYEVRMMANDSLAYATFLYQIEMFFKGERKFLFM